MQIESKEKIRERLLTLLRTQKEEDRVKKSRSVLKRLFAIPEFQQSRTVLFYAAFGGEVETSEMIEQAQNLGKKIALPIILRDQKKLKPSLVKNLTKELETGPYGVLQPRESARALSLTEIDVVVVPGVAFDRQNRRLGRGAGYYDRLLSDFPPDTPTFGLAFDFQLVDILPHQEHDVPVSRVIIN